MSKFKQLKSDLKSIQDPAKAKFLSGYFKTGKGDYGEGDVFIGLTVPQSRLIAQKYKDLPLGEIRQLLKSKVHEERLIGLLILVHNYQKGDDSKKKIVFEYYLKQTPYVNNWDLVDLSADKIVGGYLIDKTNKERDVLYRLAKSKNIWERRIAIIATFQFITKLKKYEETFKVAELLLEDKHDLIHKAVGWMLREVGKRISKEREEKFLKKHYKSMPRTMLRCAIEHFSDKERKAYLTGQR